MMISHRDTDELTRFYTVTDPKKHSKGYTVYKVTARGGEVHDGSELIGPAEPFTEFLADSLSDCSSDVQRDTSGADVLTVTSEYGGPSSESDHTSLAVDTDSLVEVDDGMASGRTSPNQPQGGAICSSSSPHLPSYLRASSCAGVSWEREGGRNHRFSTHIKLRIRFQGTHTEIMNSQRRLLNLVLVTVITGVWTADVNVPFLEYLDSESDVCLEWGFDTLKGDITFRLVVNTSGWIGFGLSPNGGMAGADMVIGGVGPNGSYFTDLHGTGNVLPLVDEQQNYFLLSMEEIKNRTFMTFRRSIQACDDKDYPISAQPVKIIYAYGTTDDVRYHDSRRGTKEVNLLNPKPRSTPSTSSFFSATVENLMVPPKITYYHCKVMRFPKLTTKHHIYMIEPVIEHKDVVHHMLLYHCPPFLNETYENECYRGDPGDTCFGVVASWAVGGGVYELPENAGIPIGIGETDIYRLEVHYNNLQKREDITDNSGLRLYYTSELRQHDVGILNLGLLPVMGRQYDIPPEADQFHTYGICETSHFAEVVNPVPEMNVFGLLLHTHLAGRKVRVGQFRGGEQIDFIGLDENYNFEMQQIVTLGNIKTIKPNDQIIIECTYSTTNRSGVTNLGLATTDEMCLAFLFYYPALPVTTCTSHPMTEYLTMKSTEKTSIYVPVYDDLQGYETLLKTLPQVQVITDDKFNWSFRETDGIRDLMETPTVSCKISNSVIRLDSSWNSVGIIIWLLWSVQLY